MRTGFLPDLALTLHCYKHIFYCSSLEYHAIVRLPAEVCKSNCLSIAIETDSSSYNKFKTKGISYKEQKSWNDISAIALLDINQFYNYISQLYDELSATQTEIKNIESDTNNIATLHKNTTTVQKYKSIYIGFQNATDKDAYFRMYEYEIILFEATQHSLKISSSST